MVRSTTGPCEHIGGVGQWSAVVTFDGGRCRSERVRGCPGGVGCGIGFGARLGGDAVGGVADDAFGLAPDPIGLGTGDRTCGPRRDAATRPGPVSGVGQGGVVPTGLQFRQGEVGGELPPPKRTGWPAALAQSFRDTE